MRHLGCIAIIPARDFTGAKSRLAPLIEPTRRAEIAAALLAHVVETARSTPGVEHVVVATDAAGPAELAGALGASVLRDPPASSLTVALRTALARLALDQPRLVLMADLPWVCAEEVATLLGGEVALAPDHHGRGTNALFLPPGIEVATFFGLRDSLSRHLTALGRRPVRRCHSLGLARDLDTPDDWANWGAATSPALARLAS